MNLGFVLDNAFTRFASCTAFSDERSRCSFAEFDQLTRRLGSGLGKLGVPRHGRIASLQGNSIELAALDVACARFGFVRCLLGTKRTTEGLRTALTLLRPDAVVFDHDAVAPLQALRESGYALPRLVCAGDGPSWSTSLQDIIARSPADAPDPRLDEDDGHSIYLTSGTTGEPKAIALTQGNWLAVLRNHLVETYRATQASDVFLHAAPMTHASGSLVMAHLARGARQHILHRFSPESALESFEREGVTATWLSPTMLTLILDYQRGRRSNTSRLKSVRFGGAPMLTHRLEEALAAWGPVLCSGWGQWEAPQQCTFFSQEQIAEAACGGNRARLGSVGQPMLFSKVAAADDAGTIVPAGASGELVVAGDHLMLGYLDDPEATSRLRVGNWQRTGDLGHVDEEGYVYITGRRREIIISGGTNVSPREIEEVIATHAAVADVAVVGLPDEVWGETIHAAVVLRSPGSIATAALLDWCAGRFPKAIRPRSVRLYDALPRNEFGKVIRSDLVRDAKS